MTYHFTQELTIRKTGFGNTVMAVLGVPTPIADELLPGSSLIDFDRHPYVARTGWGNLYGSEYPEEAVSSCTGALVTHYAGFTRTPMAMDYSVPQFWGLVGQDAADGLVLADNVSASSDLTEITFECDYDATVYVAYDLSRAAFQYVKVEKDGEEHEFSNVACLPKDSWRQAVATFRMWGETYSWGSEDMKFLTVPYTTVRKV